MITPDDLSAPALRDIVNRVRNALYTSDLDPDHEWTSETIDQVAQVLEQYHLNPDEKPE